MKYGCDDDNECAEQFLQLLEKAYWVAAIWDIEMMFACDYANSKVFAFTMNNDGSFGDEVSLVSPEANPRCIGYYYGYDIDTPNAFDFGARRSARSRPRPPRPRRPAPCSRSCRPRPRSPRSSLRPSAGAFAARLAGQLGCLVGGRGIEDDARALTGATCLR